MGLFGLLGISGPMWPPWAHGPFLLWQFPFGDGPKAVTEGRGGVHSLLEVFRENSYTCCFSFIRIVDDVCHLIWKVWILTASLPHRLQQFMPDGWAIWLIVHVANHSWLGKTLQGPARSRIPRAKQLSIGAFLFIIVSGVLLLHIASHPRISMLGHVRIIDHPASVTSSLPRIDLAQNPSRSNALAKDSNVAHPKTRRQAIACAAVLA